MAKPTFKPNKNIREAKPTKENLKYSQALLTKSEDIYKKELKIMQSEDPLPLKVQQINNLYDDYEATLYVEAEDSLTANYDQSVVTANKKLSALGIAPVTLHSADRESLRALIDYQQSNIHRWTETLRNDTIDKLYKKAYWGVRYGQGKG